jgi:acetyl esterase/lipase
MNCFAVGRNLGVGKTASARVFALSTVALLLFLSTSALAQQEPILLWPNGAPGSEGKSSAEKVRVNEYGERIVSSVHRPSITPYLPPTRESTGVAVIVIPGGGHRELWMDHEGYAVAQWLSQHGVAAFVLKYRLAREEGSTYTIEGTELSDIKRAIRLVRYRAAEWSLDADRIGVMGFSAGGELASLAATRYDTGLADADPVDRESSRPAFQALFYPGPAHDMTFTKDTPPAFLVCGEDDNTEIALGVPELYMALKHAGVSAELHVFARAGHGFGLRPTNQPPVSDWPQLFVDWLRVEGFLKRN